MAPIATTTSNEASRGDSFTSPTPNGHSHSHGHSHGHGHGHGHHDHHHGEFGTGEDWAINGSSSIFNGGPILDSRSDDEVHPTAKRGVTTSSSSAMGLIHVEGEQTVYLEDEGEIRSLFVDRGNEVTKLPDGSFSVKKTERKVEFKTLTKVPKTGLMLVGLGGNNGTTLTATVLANRHGISWNTKRGIQQPNYIGSLVRASTLRLGVNPETGKEIYVPISDVLPMVHPNDLVISGWDISSSDLGEAMARAQVLEYDLQSKLKPLMAKVKPLPSIYYPDFIAANQEERADNVIPGTDKWDHVEKIRKDIRDFKVKEGLDSVVVLWTANTERYSDIIPGVNDTAENMLKSVKASHEEVSPSSIFAIASILEGVPFINGAPQNTFVPGIIALAEEKKSFIAGDDFKSGQTKMKTIIVPGLVDAGIKPLSVVSANWLGNNDGYNLSSQRQFRSKEISKSSVVDDACEGNHLLYKPASVLNKESTDGTVHKEGERPEHLVTIKYIKPVGDDKRAADEYYSELAMGGRNIFSSFNICEDSLLATPLILDLVILAELLSRVTYREVAADGSKPEEFSKLYSILSLLSFMLKAPLVKPGTDVVNSLARQRGALEQFLKACLGLEGQGDLLLDTRVW